MRINFYRFRVQYRIKIPNVSLRASVCVTFLIAGSRLDSVSRLR